MTARGGPLNGLTKRLGKTFFGGGAGSDIDVNDSGMLVAQMPY